jgi:hypothetical protein
MEEKRPWIAKQKRYHNNWLQTILQSHSKKNSMELAQKQTRRPMEQNRRSWHKPTQLKSSNFWQRSPKRVGEKTASSKNGTGKTGYPPVEDWSYIPVSHPVLILIQTEWNISM